MKRTMVMAGIAALSLGLALSELDAAEAAAGKPAPSEQSAAAESTAVKPATRTSGPAGKPMSEAEAAKRKDIEARMAAWQEKRRQSEASRKEARQKAAEEETANERKAKLADMGGAGVKKAAGPGPAPKAKGAAKSGK